MKCENILIFVMLNMRKIPIALIIINIVKILLTYNEAHFLT